MDVVLIAVTVVDIADTARRVYGDRFEEIFRRPLPEHDYRFSVQTPTGGEITFHEGATAEHVAADDGEILTRGPGTFVGYFRDPEATADTIDPDGWLHTGDIGYLDDDGYLTITDRKKDIIITAGGKNISPSEIENALKVSPYVREAIVIGDQRRYLVTLIGIELDTVGSWAQQHRIPFTTYADKSYKT